MSTIAEKARAEGDAAETEPETTPEGEPTPEPDTEPETEPETTPEPAPAQPTEADMEKRFQQLEKESVRHGNRVREIVGDDFENLVQCPLCWTDGYVLPIPIEKRPPEQVAAVEAALGAPAGPDFKASPRHVTCQTCDGWGEVLSGAKNATNRTVSCPTCGALGYIDREGQVVTPPAGAPPQPQPNGGDPLVEQLRARGFTVIEPYVPPAGA